MTKIFHYLSCLLHSIFIFWYRCKQFYWKYDCCYLSSCFFLFYFLFIFLSSLLFKIILYQFTTVSAAMQILYRPVKGELLDISYYSLLSCHVHSCYIPSCHFLLCTVLSYSVSLSICIPISVCVCLSLSLCLSPSFSFSLSLSSILPLSIPLSLSILSFPSPLLSDLYSLNLYVKTRQKWENSMEWSWDISAPSAIRGYVRAENWTSLDLICHDL